MALAVGFGSAVAMASGVALGSACSVGNNRNIFNMMGQRREDDERVSGQQAMHQESRPEARSAPAARPRPVEDPEDAMDLLDQGFSMQEAQAHVDAAQVEAMRRTPAECLSELQRGNARFWMNKAHRPERTAFERRGLISKQFPSVAVLSCSDSRVPTEIIFDQGLGDIFVIRVAGNCLDTASMASLQYAVNHLKVKAVVVMGHEMCGAVKAAQLDNAQLEQEPTALETALKAIKQGLDTKALGQVNDTRARDREAVTQNVRFQVERLSRDKGIMGKVAKKELLVTGAFYELSSGIVDFFMEISEATTQAANVQQIKVEAPAPVTAGPKLDKFVGA